MTEFKQNYFQKRTKSKGPRANNRISSREVQVIASSGENLGILNTNEAISKANDESQNRMNSVAGGMLGGLKMPGM